MEHHAQIICPLDAFFLTHHVPELLRSSVCGLPLCLCQGLLSLIRRTIMHCYSSLATKC
uniref:Uncharacterized protein n=1 Tax=Rhizophora mucronata TaxID=61149 RepID=A0A2P2JF92_RHIMU